MPLYETDTTVTLDEFRKLNRAISKSDRTLRRYLLVLFAGLLALSVQSFLHRNYGMALFYFLLIFVAMLLLALRRSRLTRRAYTSNKLIQDAVVHLRFYDDYFEQDSPTGASHIAYADLYRIVETKTNFYLFINQNQGAIVVKSNCGSGLAAFLQNLKRKKEGRDHR